MIFAIYKDKKKVSWVLRLNSQCLFHSASLNIIVSYIEKVLIDEFNNNKTYLSSQFYNIDMSHVKYYVCAHFYMNESNYILNN